MRSRRPGLAALAVALGALTGCGSGVSTRNEAVGGRLSVYSSLPLQGAAASASQQIIGGEKLALADAGGRAGRFEVEYASLDDANPTTGLWSAEATAGNAKTAAQDTSTIAYLGDLNSGATAVSLANVNEAGIAQISPASPYAGLTSALDAGQFEPNRFYPSGRRTFARLAPGDPVEARAQVALMGLLGVRSVYVLDDQAPFEIPLAKLVAADATAAGVTVAAHDSIAVAMGAIYAGEVEKIARSGAQAVFFSGTGSEGAAGLWRQLHAANPHLLLLGPSALAEEQFATAIGTAAASTYLTTPILAPRLYPPSGQRVMRAYSRLFGGPVSGYVLYGYEAMSLVLRAIRRGGSHGNDRQVVVEGVLGAGHRDSVLGPYTLHRDGEVTASQFGVDRIAGGLLRFDRAISVP